MEYVKELREKVKEDPRIKYHPLLKKMTEQELDNLINEAIHQRVSKAVSEAVRRYV